MALSLMIEWIVSHVGTWLTPLLALLLGAFGARAVINSKAQQKIDAAQVVADHAQMRAATAQQQAANATAIAEVAKAETAAVKQAAQADKNAAAITDDKLDDAGKSRGILRD